MASIVYSGYFTKIEQFKGGRDDLDLLEIVFDQVLNYMEELIISNEG